MLRQIFRNRGAYNFVNVPVVASQDDPNGNRADYSLDWRRQYQPAQQEFREDVGLEAWDRANWWTDRQLSSTAAAKILRKRLEVYGPQREKSLQEVFSRIRSEKDAQTALKTAELFRRYRSSREQHVPFKNSTSRMILQRALEVDARDVVVKTLERKDELGFNFVSLKAYRLAITHFSSKGDLENVFRVFALARKQGMRPNRDIAFCILRACLDCNRADLAHAYALEFQENGLRVSPAQKVLIEAGSGKKIPAFRGDESDHAFDPIQFQVSEEEGEEEVMEQADRIIAAAENSDDESDVPIPSSPKAEPEASASSTETAPENQVAEEAAKAGAATEASPSKNVVAVTTVEQEEDLIIAHREEQDKQAAPLMVPGLEAAVQEKMRQLFPPKPQVPSSGLRRANSL